MPSHKSTDYKLTAVNYYLVEDKKFIFWNIILPVN